MRAVPGYRQVDLTHLAASHDGHFPRQEVYDAIEGRKRFPAHFVGDMPVWRLNYQQNSGKSMSQAEIHQRISELVDYIALLQAK